MRGGAIVDKWIHDYATARGMYYAIFDNQAVFWADGFYIHVILVWLPGDWRLRLREQLDDNWMQLLGVNNERR